MLLLRVPLQRVGLGAGVPLQALGAAARLADDLVGLGTGLGDRLVRGLLGERQHPGGTVATGALLLLHRGAHRAAHLLRAAHGAAHLLHLLLAHALAHRVAHALRAAGAAHRLEHLTAHRLDQLLLAAHGLAHLLLLAGAAHRAALADGELRGAGRQAERLVAHLLLLLRTGTHLLLRPARAHLLLLLRTGATLLAGNRRAGYGGRHRGAGARVLRRLLAHVGLVLRGGTGRGGQLGAQVLVLAEETGQLRLDLVEEGIDLVLVIAFAQADGRELLVPNVLGGQWHLFTST